MPFRTEAAVYYPLNAIFLFATPARALAISTAVHIALAGIFFYLFVNSLGVRRFSAFASALAYMFCAQHILRLFAGHLSITSSITWTPLLFFFVERYARYLRSRDLIWGTLILSFQILSDNIQIVFYTGICVILYALLRSIVLYRNTGKGRITIRYFAGVTGIFLLN
jgi:uncharacterized membrane protein